MQYFLVIYWQRFFQKKTSVTNALFYIFSAAIFYFFAKFAFLTSYINTAYSENLTDRAF